MGYTTRQYAYAQRSLAPADSTTKKDMALASGYSVGVSVAVSTHIEKTEGYANALAALASETGNVALKALATLKNRDLSRENTETLLRAIEVLADTWEKFTPQARPQKGEDPATPNSLRAIILHEVESTDVTDSGGGIDSDNDDGAEDPMDF